MTDNVVDSFARLLATKDDSERARLIARAKMLAMNAAPEEAFEPPVMPLGEYLEQPIEIPPSLVWPTLVVRGEITATLGRAGKGKTTMNLNRILKWAAGRPLFDTFSNPEGESYLAPPKPLRILIIENEGSAGMFHYKMGIMLNNCGDVLSDEDRDLIRQNVYIWGDGGYSGLKLDDPALLNKVRAGCEKVDPDILFIEPFRSLWRGEENSSTDMANMIDNLIALATDYKCGVILSHHERKSGPGEDGELMSAGRGSTALEGAAAVMENWQSVVNGDYREITWSKARYLTPPPPTRVEYDPVTSWYRHIPMDDIKQAVLEVFTRDEDVAIGVRELSEQMGETQRKLRPMLADLEKEGRLKKMASISDGNGSTGNRYRLPTGGDEQGGISF